jgi:hypothetical protein
MRAACLLSAAIVGLTGCTGVRSFLDTSPPAAATQPGTPTTGPPGPGPLGSGPLAPGPLTPGAQGPGSPPAQSPVSQFQVPQGPVPQPLAAPPWAAPVPAAPAPGTAPTPTAPPGPGTAPSPKPGATLTLQMPPDQERRLREDTQRKLDETERLLRPLASQALQPRQRELFLLAQNLLDQAKKALAAQDYERAANLTGKARTLADDLVAGK